ASHFAPRSPLGAGASVGRHAFVYSGAGACVGFAVGAFLLLWLLNFENMGVTCLLLGTLSLAAIGGLLMFLVGSFVAVATGALRSASSSANVPSSRCQHPTADGSIPSPQRPR